MKRLNFSLLVCVVLSLSCLMFGQSFGQISGTVTDPTGAVIPGAQVTITNQATGVSREFQTNDAGIYVAPQLPVGDYKITVTSKGFKTAGQTDVHLSVDDKLAINFTLTVGAVSEVVNVEAAPVQVELGTAAQQTVINGTQLRELALITRNYEQLLTLMPGVTSSSVDQLYVGVTTPGGTTATIPFSINGARNSMNSWMVDGADNVDRGSNQTLLNTPSIDALAEFKVQRSNYSAEMGRAGGGQINVVTRSGTSGFHGDVYEFVRNDAFAANNFFNNATKLNLGSDGKAKVPALRYNNFGWTLGGPVYIPGHYNTEKNKTFFFVSQEFRRVITYASGTATLPTQAEITGQFPHNICTSFTGNTCNTLATNVGKIDPVAAAYIKDIYGKLPLSASSNTLSSLFRNTFNFEQELYKVDHTFGPKLQVSGRYLRDDIPTIEPQGLFTGAPVPGVSVTNTNAPGHNWTFKGTSTLSATWFNEIGYAYSYGAIISDPTGLINSKNSPDIKSTLPFPVTLDRVPSLGFSGGTSITSFGQYRDFNRNHQLFDNMTKVHGTHAFKFGFVYNHYEKTENAGGNNAGTFSFAPASVPAGATTFEQSFANFLLGNVATFSQVSLDLTPDIKMQQWEMYAQDDWKFRPNLTFTVGLRYSNFRNPVDDKHMLTTFDPTLYKASAAVPLLTSGANIGLLPPGFNSLNYLNGISINGQTSPYGDKISAQDNGNIAPRFGFAWDPFKTGKTSVRGGYGIFYDATLVGTFEQNIFQNPPFVNSASINLVGFGNPAGGTATVSNSPKVLRAITNDFKTPYTQQWNLEIQRQFGASTQLNVAYVGTKGTHLLGIVDLNSLPPNFAYSSGLVPTTTNFTSAAGENVLNLARPFQGYNAINTIEPWFDSNYHSLQVTGQKHFKGESLVAFAYTWSKNLTDNRSDRSNAPQNRYSFHDTEYGPANFDRTHVFSLNFVYELPFYQKQQGFVGKTLGGWQLSGLASMYSGIANTVVTSNTDPAALGILGSSAASARPDLTCDPLAGALKQRTQWFNAACFTPVPAGVHRPGNEGVGVFRGPGFQGWSFSLAKNLTFGESQRFRFQLRGEASNAFNHTNPSGFGSLNNTSGLFNTITGYRDPRIVQLGGKFYF